MIRRGILTVKSTNAAGGLLILLFMNFLKIMMEIVNAQRSMGSFSGMTWGNVATAAPSFCPAWPPRFCSPSRWPPTSWAKATPPASACCGAGVFRGVLVCCCPSLLAACVPAFAGPISFVGIAVPHLVKHTLGSVTSSVNKGKWFYGNFYRGTTKSG